MSKIFKRSYNVRLPKSQHEVEEFAAKKGLIICPVGGEVYYKKHWHKNLRALNNPEVEKLAKKDTSVRFALCPADVMIKNKQYEGIITIKNVPEKLAGELEKFIYAYTRRAREIDPMDRLIDLKKSREFWEVTLTENQLANKLGRKIKKLVGKVKKQVRFIAEPGDVARVTIEFDK